MLKPLKRAPMGAPSPCDRFLLTGFLAVLVLSACGDDGGGAGGSGGSTTAFDTSGAPATTSGVTTGVADETSSSGVASSTGEECVAEPSEAGETCAEASDASCGGTFVGSTVGRDDNYQTCNTGGVFAGDVTYVIHSAGNLHYTVTVDPQATTPDYNIAVHVKRDCVEMFECLSESMIKVEGGVPGTVLNVFDMAAGETAYVIVDGVQDGSRQPTEGDYSMTVTSTSTPTATDCTNAIDISAGGSFSSTTIAAGDDYDGSGCGMGAAGEDRVYSIMTPESRTFDLRVDNTSGGGESAVALYIMTDCAAQSCVPEMQNAMLGNPRRLNFTTEPGVTYFLVVDGEMDPGVNYILHANPTASCCEPYPPAGSASRG